VNALEKCFDFVDVLRDIQFPYQLFPKNTGIRMNSLGSKAFPEVDTELMVD